MKDWKVEDKNFVITAAATSILTCVKVNRYVTITGSSGMGKTVTLRHVLLKMAESGYDIIRIIEPRDIEQYFNPSCNTVFWADNFCGSFSANKEEVPKWRIFYDQNNAYKNDNVKIVVACR